MGSNDNDNTWLYFKYGLLLILVGLFTTIIVIGINSAPSPVSYKVIEPVHGSMMKQCISEPITCTGANKEGNEFCQKSCNETTEGMEMACIETSNIGNAPTYKCGPSDIKNKCNIKYGGRFALSSWGGATNPEWDCICQWPEYSAVSPCNDLNPGLCENGTFEWDASLDIPEKAICKCDHGYTLLCSNYGSIPNCVKDEDVSLYTDTSYAGVGGSCIIPPVITIGDNRWVEESRVYIPVVLILCILFVGVSIIRDKFKN